MVDNINKIQYNISIIRNKKRKGKKYMETIKEYLLRLLAENLNMIESKGIELKEGLLNVDPTIYDMFKVDELSNKRVNELIKLTYEDRKTIEAL